MRIDRLGVTLGLAMLCSATPALAVGEDECQTDADCAAGLGCVEQTYTICESSAGAGGQGGAVEETTCYDVVAHVCAPRPCTSDAECGGGTSCVAFTYETCSGGGSTPGTGTGGAGGAPDTGGGRGGEPGTGGDGAYGGGGAYGGAGGGAGGEECVTVTESYCVPPWLAPCELDNDCGPGFRCVAEELCTSTPDGDAGGYGGADCVPSDVKHCELVPTPCTATAECGAGLVCQDFSEWMCGPGEEPPPPPVGGEGGAGGAGGTPADDGTGGRADGGGAGGAAGGAGGTPAEPDCGDQPTSFCVPPGFVDWMLAYGPTRNGDGTAGGVGGYGGAGYPEGAGGAGAPAANDGSSSATADAGSGSGCQTGGGGLSMLALLGAAWLVRRR